MIPRARAAVLRCYYSYMESIDIMFFKINIRAFCYVLVVAVVVVVYIEKIGLLQ